jgi:hypothetical protein
MNTDQLEVLGEDVARAIKSKFGLDYIRFDAGTGGFEKPTPWATLFIAKRGYISQVHHEFPHAQVQAWLTMPENQAREALAAAFESRAKSLVKDEPDRGHPEMARKVANDKRISTLFFLLGARAFIEQVMLEVPELWEIQHLPL